MVFDSFELTTDIIIMVLPGEVFIDIQLSPSYKATTSAGLRWPYKAGGLCIGGTCPSGPTVNAQRMRPHMPGGCWRGGLIRGVLLYSP